MGTVINSEYKDRLFRFLFGDERNKKNALDLYNAINGTNYHNVDDLVFNTIDDYIYMGMRNDSSFILRDELSVYEQQSTFNPNMPVRGLMYFGKLYDKIIKERGLNVYGSKLLKLPAPMYIVFYNGTEKKYKDSDVFELRLSDTFDDKNSCIELTAKVYNINYGRNKQLMETCKVLSDYAKFVVKVRNFVPKYNVEEAVDKAVNECINEGILADVLTAHKAEVRGMVITEYNEVETMKGFYSDGHSDGLVEGFSKGESETLYSLVAEGNLDVAIAANKMHLTTDQFTSRMLAAGYKLSQ